MSKRELLDNLFFGNVDSESEEELDKIFIQTKDFKKFLEEKTAVVIGAKGAGKSALYRYFTNFEKSARRDTGAELEDVIIVSGTGFKDVANLDCPEIRNEMREDKFDFYAAWNIYLMYRLVYTLYDKQEMICGENSKSILIKQGKVEDKRLFGVIKKLCKRFLFDVPEVDEINFSEVSIKVAKNKKIPAQNVLKEIDEKLGQTRKTVWVLLDKIDELFSYESGVRKACIEGLFTTLLDYQSRYKNFRLKIFVRSDIWSDLNFVNKSHLADKQVRLQWDANDLQKMVVKRACVNEKIVNFLKESLNDEDYQKQIKDCFYTLFPPKVYSGAREATTINYLIDRITDGQGGVYPRELINFCNEAVNQEKELMTGDEQIVPLLSGVAIRNAFGIVSDNKVNTYLSEFGHLKEHFKRFEGQTTMTFTKDELLRLMVGLTPSGDEMIRQLYETGILQPNSSSIIASSSYAVPRLFRGGLKMIIKGRP